MKENLSQYIGKRIRKYRKDMKLTQDELAKKLNTSKGTISNYETGYRSPRQDDLFLLAEVLNINIDDLFPPREDNKIETHNIPVVSKISAGEPIHAEENIESYIAIPNAKENTFGLIVSGDSMDKEFKDGDIVVVEKDAVVENGQIGVVHINGYNATVKRIKYNDDDIILIPESNNNEHVPKIFNRNDHIHIVGRVVGDRKSTRLNSSHTS